MTPIRAELTSGSSCAALSMTVTAAVPILALCRKLIDAGHDPATPLDVYRGKTLALRIRSIGEAAAIEIRGDCVGFRPARGLGTGSPVRLQERAAA